MQKSNLKIEYIIQYFNTSNFTNTAIQIFLPWNEWFHNKMDIKGRHNWFKKKIYFIILVRLVWFKENQNSVNAKKKISNKNQWTMWTRSFVRNEKIDCILYRQDKGLKMYQRGKKNHKKANDEIHSFLFDTFIEIIGKGVLAFWAFIKGLQCI